jgi:hypothetical protein
MARVIQFHRTGGPEVLQFDEVDIGAPGLGELRLRVHAFGLRPQHDLQSWPSFSAERPYDDKITSKQESVSQESK